MARMGTCGECGLPIPACNALAFYRSAAVYLDRGLIQEAKDATTSAREFEAEFNERRKNEE